MKVLTRFSKAATVGRKVVTVALSAVMMLAAAASPAHAITRAEVLRRANSWIKKRVMYSQSSYYQGYRQDCSGFVSMAWKLKTSYTSSDIGSRAHRISVKSLKPGDAVRRPGHVEIFDGWKNKRKREYWALEESTWGVPAVRRVKHFGHGYTALRLRGIKDNPSPIKAIPIPPVAAPVPVPSIPPTGSVDTSGSIDSSGSVATTLTPSTSPSTPLFPVLVP